MDPQLLQSTTPPVDVATLATSANVMAPSWSFFDLFTKADLVVQLVMLMLLVVSVFCWALIIDKSLKIRRSCRQLDVWKKKTSNNLGWGQLVQFIKDDSSVAGARIAQAILSEWDFINNTVRQANDGEVSLQEAENRLEKRALQVVDQEVTYLEKGLSILASTGSVAPFIGLFGTVWGIMNSFMSIASNQDNSLIVVAPGIAEALLATALGLVAAIPAVLAYNRLSSSLYQYAQQLEIFATQIVKTILVKLGQESSSR